MSDVLYWCKRCDKVEIDRERLPAKECSNCGRIMVETEMPYSFYQNIGEEKVLSDLKKKYQKVEQIKPENRDLTQLKDDIRAIRKYLWYFVVLSIIGLSDGLISVIVSLARK